MDDSKCSFFHCAKWAWSNNSLVANHTISIILYQVVINPAWKLRFGHVNPRLPDNKQCIVVDSRIRLVTICLDLCYNACFLSWGVTSTRSRLKSLAPPNTRRYVEPKKATTIRGGNPWHRDVTNAEFSTALNAHSPWLGSHRTVHARLHHAIVIYAQLTFGCRAFNTTQLTRHLISLDTRVWRLNRRWIRHLSSHWIPAHDTSSVEFRDPHPWPITIVRLWPWVREGS